MSIAKVTKRGSQKIKAPEDSKISRLENALTANGAYSKGVLFAMFILAVAFFVLFFMSS